MSLQHYSDNCPGCQPAMVDGETMQPLPANHRYMRCIRAVWAKTTPEERQAWHRFTCQNSKEPLDVLTATGIASQFAMEIAKKENEKPA